MSGHEQPDFYEVDEGYEPDDTKHECGIAGIWAPGLPVAQMTRQALTELQHRGQSAAGVYVYGDWRPEGVKDLGMVNIALPPQVVEKLDDDTRSPVAVGHVRWNTTPNNTVEAAQPFAADNLTMAHNGHVEGLQAVADYFEIDVSECLSDSHMLTVLIDTATGWYGSVEKALKTVLPHVRGAYCLSITDGEKLYAVRDPWGFHPLIIGELPGGGYMVASESVALDDAGIEPGRQRDVEQGEIVTIGPDGVSYDRIELDAPRKGCMVEYMYLVREDSRVDGVAIREARYNMGRLLAEVAPVEADIIVPVPNSGRPSARGYADAAGVPYMEALTRNKKANRTFIEPDGVRQRLLREKFSLDPDAVQGKRLVYVDDSVIRGSTMEVLVEMAFAAGATEVHVRSAAPRNVNPCYMGVDTGDPNTLVARGRSDAQIARRFKATSVAYNTIDNIEEAVRLASDEQRRDIGRRLCTACVDGKYPFDVPGQDMQRIVHQEPAARWRRLAVALGMPAIGRRRPAA